MVFCRVTRLTVTEKPSDFIVEQEAGADLLNDPVVRHHRPFGQGNVRSGIVVLIRCLYHTQTSNSSHSRLTRSISFLNRSSPRILSSQGSFWESSG